MTLQINLTQEELNWLKDNLESQLEAFTFDEDEREMFECVLKRLDEAK